MYSQFLKRSFDILFSVIGLVVVSPILLMVFVCVALNFGFPAVFKQPRIGKDGKPFTIYKFRTMTDARDSNNELLPDDARLTKFGAYLRKFSLDELPQLANVLKGDMSFIGPRPWLPKYFILVSSPERSRRHAVRPGITGMAQINGRDELSYDDRFRLDMWYVDNFSIWIDIKILCRTIVYVLHPKATHKT